MNDDAREPVENKPITDEKEKGVQKSAKGDSESQKPDGLAKGSFLVTYALFFTGLVLVLISVIVSEVKELAHIIVVFIRDLGVLLSAAMAGTIVYEKFLRGEMVSNIGKELDRKLESRVPPMEESAENTARAVHALFTNYPPQMTGIKLLNSFRRNYHKYYDWVNNQEVQELFFAGRSVLHRIDADVRTRSLAAAEDILFRKLKEGSKIKILFLDPRANILERLANEEGQRLESMLGDIATSLGICKRLSNLLKEKYKRLPANSELDIRIYDCIPYFAFHKQDEQVILGFYFPSMGLGSSSPAYEIIDDKTRQVFSGHFEHILAQAVSGSLVGFSGARGEPNFYEDLFDELCKYLQQKLGKEKTDKLLA
jgi:hypothetical protein